MGKGGGSSSTHADMEPKTQEQLDLENRFYDLFGGVMNGYASGNFNNAFSNITNAVGNGTSAGNLGNWGTSTGSAGQTSNSSNKKGALGMGSNVQRDSMQGTGGGFKSDNSGGTTYYANPTLNNMAKQQGTGGTSTAQQGSKGTGGTSTAQQGSKGTGGTSTAQQGSKGTGGTQYPQGYNTATLNGGFQNASSMVNQNNARQNQLLGDADHYTQGQANALNSANTAGNQAKALGMNAFGNANSMYNQANDLYGKAEGIFDNAANAGNADYDAARAAYDRANGMIVSGNDAASAAKESNKWYDDYSRGQLTTANDLLKSGEIPAELEARYMDSINRGMKSSMGSMLNDAAGRGVINSSITGKGISDLGQQAANAYTDNYLNTFNSVLGGHQNNASIAGQNGQAFGNLYNDINNNLNSGANTAIGLGDSRAALGGQMVNNQMNTGNAIAGLGQGVNAIGDSLSGLGSSYQNAGSQNIADQLGIASGYNQGAQQNLAEREALLNDQSKYWQNAMGPYGMALDFLQQMQAARGTQTTVMDQSKK